VPHIALVVEFGLMARLSARCRRGQENDCFALNRHTGWGQYVLDGYGQDSGSGRHRQGDILAREFPGCCALDTEAASQAVLADEIVTSHLWPCGRLAAGR
jgi:hypothetical protein